MRAMILLRMTVGGLLINGLRGLRFHLAGGLILGEVKLLLDLALAAAQVLV